MMWIEFKIMDEGIQDIRKLRMDIFEKENPKGVDKLKKILEKKMLKTNKEIEKIIEKEVDNYFKDKKIKVGIPSYVG